MKKNLLLVIAALFVSTSNISLPKKETKKLKFPVQFSEALAATVLNGSANFGTAQGYANFARFNYYLVNGVAPGYTIPGNSAGYMGILNQFLESLGGGLGDLGYETCASIPDTGTASFDSFTVTFSTGAKTIPSHFGSQGGATFEKKVVIKEGSTTLVQVELSCSDSSSVTSGYILTPATAGNGEVGTGGFGFECYFQQDSDTNSNYADFYLTSNNSGLNIKQAVRFLAPTPDTYTLYSLTTQNGIGRAVSLNGDANGEVAINAIYVFNLTTPAASQNIDDASGLSNTANQIVGYSCIDLGTNQSVGSCNAVPAPTPMSIGGVTYNFNLASINNLVLSTPN